MASNTVNVNNFLIETVYFKVNNEQNFQYLYVNGTKDKAIEMISKAVSEISEKKFFESRIYFVDAEGNTYGTDDDDDDDRPSGEYARMLYEKALEKQKKIVLELRKIKEEIDNNVKNILFGTTIPLTTVSEKGQSKDSIINNNIFNTEKSASIDFTSMLNNLETDTKLDQFRSYSDPKRTISTVSDLDQIRSLSNVSSSDPQPLENLRELAKLK